MTVSRKIGSLSRARAEVKPRTKPFFLMGGDRVRANSNSKSGVRGVHWDKTQNRWMVMISINGIQRYVGRYADIEDAKAAFYAAHEKAKQQKAAYDAVITQSGSSD